MNTFIITMAIFVALTFFTGLVSVNYYKKHHREKMWKLIGIRVSFWQEVVLISIALTMLVLLLLKWMNILSA